MARLKFLEYFSILVLIISIQFTRSSKLNVPRVLLPLFKDFSVNFTLEATEGDCFRWSTTRNDLIQLTPLEYDDESECSPKVVVSTTSREMMRNIAVVLAEDVQTGQFLRCDVLVDNISSLTLTTTTRELFMDEAPEAFEVRALDDQGNEFSTLEGVEFDWQFMSVGPKKDLMVLRYLTFGESPYETPDTVVELEDKGKKGHMILLEGTKTGSAKVIVRLPYEEYKDLQPCDVNLAVIANLIITPAEVYTMVGDIVEYKVIHMSNGKMEEINLAASQYYLDVENKIIASSDKSKGEVSALKIGKTLVMLHDRNMDVSDPALKLPAAVLNVVEPSYMVLNILPHHNWVILVNDYHDIVAEVYSKTDYKLNLGPGVEIQTQIGDEFHVQRRSVNGSWLTGWGANPGVAPVSASLTGVTHPRMGRFALERAIIAQADILVYPRIVMSPSEVVLPWDPELKPRYEIGITAVGGDGKFLWTSSNHSIGVVSQTGIVKTHSQGFFEVAASMQRNHNNRETTKFLIIPPSRLEIVDYVMEAEVGTAIFLHVALYADRPGAKPEEHIPYTHCHQLPLITKSSNPKFVVNKSATIEPVGISCANVAIVGLAVGTTKVSVMLYQGDNQMEDSVTIGAFKPLRLLHPPGNEVVLAVGTTINLVFTGGPKRFVSQPTLHIRTVALSDNATVDAKDVTDSHSVPGESEITVVHVLCKQLGESVVTLSITNNPHYANLKHVGSSVEVTVICGKPRQLKVKPDMKIADPNACPIDLTPNRVVVQNNQEIDLDVVVRDETGRKFANVSSLKFNWKVIPSSYNVMNKTDGIFERIEMLGTIPLSQKTYQTLGTKFKKGEITVTATVVGYHTNILGKYGITAESPVFLSDDEKTSELSPIFAEVNMLLVDNIIVTPNSTFIYNYPGNTKVLTVSQGSGFYQLSLSNTEIADVHYVEGSSEIEVLPLKDGLLTVTLTDLCLVADPVHIKLIVVSVKIIRVEMTDKIEVGKCVPCFVKLYDENDNLLQLTELNMVSMAVTVKDEIIAVEKLKNDEYDPWPVGEIHYIVTGVELGETSLMFSIGSGDRVVESAPLEIQVFPPLRIYPRDGKLLVGSALQFNSRGGPEPDSLIEYNATEPNYVDMQLNGLVRGLKVGTVRVHAKSVGINPTTGFRVLYSQDFVDLEVIALSGIRISAPLTRFYVGATVPIWVTGVPDKLSPIVLGTIEPPILFEWSIDDGDIAQIRGSFEHTGIANSPGEMISIKVDGVAQGKTALRLNATVSGAVVGQPKKPTVMFSSSVDIEVFEGFKLTYPENFESSSILLSPQSTIQLQTNMDNINTVFYALSTDINSEDDKSLAVSNWVVSISKTGLLESHGLLGTAMIVISCYDPYGLKQTINLAVEVKPVHFMMLNVVTTWLVENFLEPVTQVPLGVEFELQATYHDNKGSKFTAVSSALQVRSSRVELIQMRSVHDNHTLLIRTRKLGVTMLKVWSDVDSKAVDYLKINTKRYTGYLTEYVSSGDILCLSTPLRHSKDGSLGIWTSSDRQLVTIDKDTGVARVIGLRGGNIQLSHSLHPAASIQLPVMPVTRLVMMVNPDMSLTNTADAVQQVPLVLLSDAAASEATPKVNNMLNAWQCDEELMKSPMSFLFKCHIKFTNDTILIETERVLKVESNFDYKKGSYCCDVLPGPDVGPAISILKTTVAIWATIEGTEIEAEPVELNFHPAVFFEHELTLDDKTFSATLELHGLREILKEVIVKPVDEQLISVIQEPSKNHDIKKFHVKLVEWHWKLSTMDNALDVVVTSPLTNQVVQVNVKASDLLKTEGCSMGQESSVMSYLYHYRHALALIVSMFVVFIVTFYAYSNYVQPVINVNVDADRRSLLYGPGDRTCNRMLPGRASAAAVLYNGNDRSRSGSCSLNRTLNQSGSANKTFTEPVYGDASMFYTTSPELRRNRRFCQ